MTAEASIDRTAKELFRVGLTVGDLEQSLSFYVGAVGFEVVERIHRRSAAFDELMGNGSATEVKVAYLSLDGFVLQLIQYAQGSGAPLQLDHNRPGSPHLCFYVDDAEATHARLAAAGDIEITSEPTQVSPTMLSFYTRDPDGVPVEFLERTEPVKGWSRSVDVTEADV
jgi:catechol 2,3-dioxygenase-like lactoylglutathione lyase family enzyme